MASRCCKRRSPSSRTAAAVMLAAAATRMCNVAAFTSIDTTFSSILSITSPRVSTKLFASENAPGDEKLPFETVTDENRHTLLAGDRPVLVDAFAPWCGPCKLLDKVLKKAQPRYTDKVDFVKWNVNDKEGTAEIKQTFLDGGFTLTKLPSLIVFREGKPVAVRAGMANEFQLDDFLEKTLPDVLERTFDENGIKMIPLPEEMMMQQEEEEKKKEPAKVTTNALNKKEDLIAEMAKLSSASAAIEEILEDEAEDLCSDPVECLELLEKTVWQNRTVVPALDGILLPSRSYGSP